MAQMTRNTLFGPVLLVVALPEPLNSTVAPIFVVDKNELRKNLISKKKARKKKTRTSSPNNAIHVVWARSPRRRLP